MKKSILFFALLLPFISMAQALSGTYLVGSSQAAPFNTLNNAVARINSSGVSGPVVFLLDNTDYSNATGETFPIKILQFAGTSAVNTLKIKPNTGKTVTITANPFGNGYTATPAAIQFDGADNIIIDGSNIANGTTRNLTITNNDNISYQPRTSVWISSNGNNGATNVSVNNTKIRITNRNQEQLLLSGIYSGSNSLGANNTLNVASATADNAQTTVANNEFINIRQGIYINGNSAVRTSNTQIVSNQFGSTTDAEKPSRPIYLVNISSANITDNVISGILNNSYSDLFLSGIEIDNATGYTIRRNTLTDLRLTTNAITGYGIWIKGASTNGIISENKLSNIKNTGGGIMKALGLDLDNGITANLQIANNFLSDIASNGTTTNTAHGIYIQSGKTIRIYHNSVALNASQSGQSATLYINGGSELDIRNNIFVNSSSSGVRYAVYANVAASAFTAIDFNDYYSQPVGFLGSDRVTLANWKTATGKDAASVYTNPVFTSATDLHLVPASNATLDNFGTPIAAVPTDINTNIRSTINPDMGADEFSLPAVLSAQPTTQATAVTFSTVTAAGFTVNWTNGNGARRLVLLRSGSAVNAPPVDGETYSAQSAFATGSQIGTGNYVVYSGSENSVVVTGLSAATTYHVAVYELNGTGGTENYLTTTPATNSRMTLNASMGWQILAVNTLHTIDFDTTVDGVNKDAFQGAGILPAAVTGKLNSNAWSISGFSDGNIPFGGTNTLNEDFDRGLSTGGISEGGIYAFATTPGNTSLGIQPATGDFAPGAVTLRIQNQTGVTITSLNIGYKVYVYNNEAGSGNFNFSHSADNNTYTAQNQIDLIVQAAADPVRQWKVNYRVITLSGLNIGANGFYYLRWTGNTVSGTVFDELALDDIMVSANPTTTYAAFSGTADTFSVAGNAILSANTTVTGALTLGNGKLDINGKILSLAGPVNNTVAGGLKGSSTSGISFIGSVSSALSMDQTTQGSTNALQNLTIGTTGSNSVALAAPVLVNGTLTTDVGQSLNLVTYPLTGMLATIVNNGTIRTQNTSSTALPAGKTWGGTIIYDALASAQTVAIGTYENLTITTPGGAVAAGAITVNGLLDLPVANPTAFAGSLSMGNYIVTMGATAANSGIGDVTGIISRNTILPNQVYTFGHANTSITFPNVGTLPTTASIKVAIGTAPSWRPGAIKRTYDFIQNGGTGTKAVIKSHYLDSELNGNDEMRLVDWTYTASTGIQGEQGRSNFSTIENFVELTNVNVAFFVNAFDAKFLTMDESFVVSSTWTGLVSSSWTTVGNWDPQATPSDYTAVIIPDAATTPNDPTINPQVLLGSLLIERGGILNAPDNSLFTINNGAGAWINYGTYNPGGGTSKVVFTNLDATIAGTTNFNSITINSGAGLRPLTGSTIRIADTFSRVGNFSPGPIENTVEYTGTNQIIATPTGSAPAYHNLIISGTGAIFPTTTGIMGNFTLNQPADFTGKAVNMLGYDLQHIGGTSNPIFNDLTINNSAGEVLLDTNITTTGTLTLSAGNLTLGNHNLTLGNNAVAGTFDVSRMLVINGTGEVRRPYTGTGSYFFPIGEKTSNPAYSPINVAITSGTFSNAYVGVAVVDAIHPDNHSTQHYISRYWKVNQSGITNAVATITANYITPEVLVAESTMSAAQLTGTFNQQTNPWVRYQSLNNLTLTAVGAPLAAGQTSYFTGIRGGTFSTAVTGSGTFCQDAPVTLAASVTGGDAPYTYSWSGSLGTTATATPPTTTTGSVNYILTAKDGNGITAVNNATVVTLAPIATGTMSAEQTICSGSQPSNLTLTGTSATVTQWQRSDDENFNTFQVIANTSTTLAGSTIGNISATTYFRAVLSNGSCETFSAPTAVRIKSTTWTGSGWSNGIPDSTTTAVIVADYNQQSSIDACRLIVINNAVVTIRSAEHLNLQGGLEITNGSNFTLSNNTNFLQPSNAVNTGIINVRRHSAPLFRLDYTLWSSPVYTIAPATAQTLLNFSPRTVPGRFYTYTPSTDFYTVVPDPSATAFASGKGYLIRMPDNWIANSGGNAADTWGDNENAPDAATDRQGIFTGTPFNGPLAIPVTANTYNAVGNPYPSVIDANLFMQANGNPSALYFWRKTNNAAASSYATYTYAGGAGTSANVGDPSSVVPNGKIQVGQGFITKVSGNQIVFNNSMREINTNNQFFRGMPVERHRFWLNLSTNQVMVSQTLVAYMTGATMDLDPAIDGPYINDSQVALTSVINGSEYAIQGRSLPFDAADVVAIGFKAITAGNYTIGLDHKDGLFLEGQHIYLRDNLTNAITDLTVGSYTFAAEAGASHSRFDIIYESALSAENPIRSENGIIAYKQGQDIIVNSGRIVMSSVQVFDIRGRLLMEQKDIHANETSLNTGTVNQVLILKITTDDHKIVTKKVVN